MSCSWTALQKVIRKREGKKLCKYHNIVCFKWRLAVPGGVTRKGLEVDGTIAGVTLCVKPMCPQELPVDRC